MPRKLKVKEVLLEDPIVLLERELKEISEEIVSRDIKESGRE